MPARRPIGSLWQRMTARPPVPRDGWGHPLPADALATFPYYGCGRSSGRAPPPPANADILAYVAAMGGNAVIPRIYASRYLLNGVPTTNALVGAIPRWDDARGHTGFGPPLPIVGAPQLVGSGPSSYFITTNGTTSGLLSVAAADLDLSVPFTLISVRTLITVASYSTFNPYIGVGGAANVPYIGSLPGATISVPINLESYFFEPGNEHQDVTPPAILTFDGRTMLEAFTVNGTAGQLIFPPAPTQAVTLASGPSAGNNKLGVGIDGSGTLFGASAHRLIVCVLGVATAAQLLTSVKFAVANELALNDAPQFLFFDGDSLTFGFSLADQSQCYPVQLMALAHYTSGWAYCQTGTPSIFLAGVGGLIARAPTIVDVAYNYSQTRAENICVFWGGTNDEAVSGTSGPATFALQQQYINARLAVGWKVVIIPIIDRGDHNISVQRASSNGSLTATYGGGAVPGVALVTLPSTLMADNSWMDATFYLADRVHLTQAGYALVATGVDTAVQSLL